MGNRRIVSSPPQLIAALVLMVASGTAGAGDTIIRPETGHGVPFAQLIGKLARADVVLVGERHDDYAQHRVQQEVITGLLAGGPVAVGMEAFEGRRDPELARWRRGEFDSWPGFLAEVDWYRHWGVDPELYRPILQTVRRHRLPLAGMNVPRDWIGRIARDGMGALNAAQRARIGPVAPAQEAYRKGLKRSLAEHDGGRRAEDFIAAQTAWDAAMAGALLDLRKAHPEAVVVGLAGSGHIRGGHGIPHQLRSRATDLEVRTVLPYDPAEGRPEADAADYLWPVPPDRAPEAVRIGARLGAQDAGPGVALEGVREAWPAKKAGLRKGDRILAVDGEAVANRTELIHRIRDHRWGGCLRLRVRRGGEERVLTVSLERPSEAESDAG